MELLFELLFSLVWEIVGELVAELVLQMGLSSVSHAVREPAPNPVLGSAGCVILGAIAGGLTLAFAPHRILPPPPFPGLSLLVAPVLSGVVMKSFGDRRRTLGYRTTWVATFWGGAAFAFAMAAVRLAVVLHLAA